MLRIEKLAFNYALLAYQIFSVHAFLLHSRWHLGVMLCISYFIPLDGLENELCSKDAAVLSNVQYMLSQPNFHRSVQHMQWLLFP